MREVELSVKKAAPGIPYTDDAVLDRQDLGIHMSIVRLYRCVQQEYIILAKLKTILYVLLLIHHYCDYRTRQASVSTIYFKPVPGNAGFLCVFN